MKHFEQPCKLFFKTKIFILDDEVPSNGDYGVPAESCFIENATLVLETRPDAKIFYTGDAFYEKTTSFLKEHNIPIIKKHDVGKVLLKLVQESSSGTTEESSAERSETDQGTVLAELQKRLSGIELSEELARAYGMDFLQRVFAQYGAAPEAWDFLNKQLQSFQPRKSELFAPNREQSWPPSHGSLRELIWKMLRGVINVK